MANQLKTNVLKLSTKALKALLGGRRSNTTLVRPPIADSRVFDFYSGKSSDLPRLVYRRLMSRLNGVEDAAKRANAIDDFLKEINDGQSKGDYQKLKWAMPDYLASLLNDDERSKIETSLLRLRERRNRRMMLVYPHCSDEFSLHSSFIDSVFDGNPFPVISPKTRVFTLGSCFARNIAVFLQGKGYNANAFMQAEDLNSPLSNSKMFAVATLEPTARKSFLAQWIDVLNPGMTKGAREAMIEQENARLLALVAEVKQADVIVVTVGNTLDFFLDDAVDQRDGAGNVAPKFLALLQSEDVSKRSGYAKRLKDSGANFRMANYAEAREALRNLHGVIRGINADALCIFTLSPVPMDSAIGLTTGYGYGAIEVDTISKSTLRAALFELFEDWSKSSPRTHYFPSFEIVRWIGSMLNGPAFGMEDAASRHVSAQLLSNVYAFFLRKYAEPDASPADATRRP